MKRIETTMNLLQYSMNAGDDKIKKKIKQPWCKNILQICIQLWKENMYKNVGLCDSRMMQLESGIP
jgi:hypothetical protein